MVGAKWPEAQCRRHERQPCAGGLSPAYVSWAVASGGGGASRVALRAEPDAGLLSRHRGEGAPRRIAMEAMRPSEHGARPLAPDHGLWSTDYELQDKDYGRATRGVSMLNAARPGRRP